MIDITSTVKATALNEVKAQLSRLDAAIQSTSDQPQSDGKDGLPKKLATEIRTTVNLLESFLYAFSDSSTFDPYKTYDYLSASSRFFCPDICIHKSNDLILIRLPYLPPRGRGANALVNKQFANILRKEQFPVWKEWTASFWHIYPANTRRVPKDVDNYDYKKTIDLLTFALGSSDNPIQFDMEMATQFTDEIPPGTYIAAVPQKKECPPFHVWNSLLFPNPKCP